MKPLTANIIRNKILLTFFLTMYSLLHAQDSLSYLEFLQQVKTHHPLAQRTRIIEEQGQLLVREARGGFDPVLTSKMKEKYFQDKFYYNIFETDLSVQTITGVQVSAGYGNNNGLFLNPENYTPNKPNIGTGYMGLSVPLGKGLFFDETRLALRSSQQMQKQYIAEANLQLNDLLFQASDAYWEWFANYSISRNLENSVILARDRYIMIKQEEQVGELSPVDTLKAFLQYKDRLVESIEARKNEVASYFELRKWIWDTVLIQVIDLRPSQKSIAEAQMLMSVWSIDNHPKIRQLDAKISQSRFDRRYKIEKIKPKLNFDYRLLYNQTMPTFDGFGSNQLWGLSFEYPLFLRAERAALKQSNLKISSLELEMTNARNELSLKYENEINQLDLLNDQQKQLFSMVNDYSRLLNFENSKFNMGESTLFELNSWELKLLESQNKLVKVESKSALTYSKLLWYSNSFKSFLQ